MTTRPGPFHSHRSYVLGNRPTLEGKKEASMIRMDSAIKLLTTVLLNVATALAQSSDRSPVTDAEKIAEALRAGPAFITQNATLLDWPSASGAEYRLLRKGSNEWTCLPAIPGYPHDAPDAGFKAEPGCYDPIFLRGDAGQHGRPHPAHRSHWPLVHVSRRLETGEKSLRA
jgi:hypothetical protein